MITYNNLIFYFINKYENILKNKDYEDEDDDEDDDRDYGDDEDRDYDNDEDDYNEFNIRPVPSYYEEDDEIEEDWIKPWMHFNI